MRKCPYFLVLSLATLFLTLSTVSHAEDEYFPEDSSFLDSDEFASCEESSEFEDASEEDYSYEPDGNGDSYFSSNEPGADQYYSENDSEGQAYQSSEDDNTSSEDGAPSVEGQSYDVASWGGEGGAPSAGGVETAPWDPRQKIEIPRKPPAPKPCDPMRTRFYPKPDWRPPVTPTSTTSSACKLVVAAGGVLCIPVTIAIGIVVGDQLLEDATNGDGSALPRDDTAAQSTISF